MRSVLIFGVVICLLSGCGRKEAPPPPVGAQQVHPSQNLYQAAAGTGQPSDGSGSNTAGAVPVYQGLTPAQWGERLQAPDLKTQTEAIQALGAMKEQGYPELKKGLQSDSPDVRMLSLEAIQLPVV